MAAARLAVGAAGGSSPFTAPKPNTTPLAVCASPVSFECFGRFSAAAKTAERTWSARVLDSRDRDSRTLDAATTDCLSRFLDLRFMGVARSRGPREGSGMERAARLAGLCGVGCSERLVESNRFHSGPARIMLSIAFGNTWSRAAHVCDALAGHFLTAPPSFASSRCSFNRPQPRSGLVPTSTMSFKPLFKQPAVLLFIALLVLAVGNASAGVVDSVDSLDIAALENAETMIALEGRSLDERLIYPWRYAPTCCQKCSLLVRADSRRGRYRSPTNCRLFRPRVAAPHRSLSSSTRLR